MKYKIRVKSPRESEIQYHEEILKDFEKIFNIKIRSVYDNESNRSEEHTCHDRQSRMPSSAWI